MNAIVPYLNFNGTAEEAFNFYKEILDGEIFMLQRFSDVPNMDVPDDYKNKVLHVNGKFAGTHLMASDCPPGVSVKQGDNISLSINCTAADEVDRVHSKLAEGGKITMPVEDTFWGARFGMVTDRFGINWMLNFDYEKKD